MYFMHPKIEQMAIVRDKMKKDISQYMLDFSPIHPQKIKTSFYRILFREVYSIIKTWHPFLNTTDLN